MDHITFFLLLYQAVASQYTVPTAPLHNTKVIETVVASRTEPSTDANSEDAAKALYNELALEQYDLSFDVFNYALTGYHNLRNEAKLSDQQIISIIDFTKSS